MLPTPGGAARGLLRVLPRPAGAFPLPGCPTCGAQLTCEAKGRSEERYPRCRVPVRGTDLGRVNELFTFLKRWHGFEDPALDGLEAVILDLFGRDDFAWSDSLELSVSHDDAGWHLFRFSYALPWYSQDRAGAEASVMACAAPFGRAVAAATEARLVAARAPCVDFPIAGVAYDGAGRFRHKIYFQFHDHRSDEALRVAEAVTGFTGLARRFAGAPLHLLGVDTRPDGSVGEAKLYMMHPRFDASASAEPMLKALGEAGLAEIQKLLIIHRLRGADDPGGERASEIDFALRDNDLLWEELARLPEIAGHLASGDAWDGIRRTFRTGVRRISLPLHDARKVNIYYVLAEAATMMRGP